MVFDYYCPKCMEGFVGELEDGRDSLKEKHTCEDCGQEFTLEVRTEIIVGTSMVPKEKDALIF